MKKHLLKAFFDQVEGGCFSVRYWDGEEVWYGTGEPRVKVIFHRAPPLGLDLDEPALAFGEAYMDEVIDFEGSLEEIIRVVELNKDNFSNPGLKGKVFKGLNNTICALKQKQEQNIRHHYDLGNDFFSLWLDETMSYSCGYFKSPGDSLYQAQIQKIDHILRKLNLNPGERLLDIGSGWGWLVIRAAQLYGVQALGITISEEQYRASRERVRELGLADQVEVRRQDYLDLDEKKEQFDKVVSVGMFEHVGKENLPRYMDKVSKLLVHGGLSMLHTITGVREKPVNAWTERYIFPGGYIPSLRETVWLLPEYGFHLWHIESLRMHYAMTLDRWYENFCRHLDKIERRFGKRFLRMWSLYLRGAAASFRVSGLNVHQLLFSKGLNNEVPLTLEHVYS